MSIGPSTGMFFARVSKNQAYRAFSTLSYSGARTRHAPERPHCAAFAFTSALWRSIVLKVLRGIPNSLATDDFFSPASTRRMISAFVEKSNFLRFFASMAPKRVTRRRKNKTNTHHTSRVSRRSNHCHWPSGESGPLRRSSKQAQARRNWIFLPPQLSLARNLSPAFFTTRLRRPRSL